jgi:hypothetical protein
MKPWRIAPGLTFTRGLLQIFQAEDIMEGLNFNLKLGDGFTALALPCFTTSINIIVRTTIINVNKIKTTTIRRVTIGVFTAEDNTEMITIIAAIVMIIGMMIAVAMMVTVMPSPYQYRAWESPIKESSVSTHYLAGSLSDGGWQ